MLKNLNDHRPILVRYTFLQLRDETVAEDAVQETLLAALQAGDSFRRADQTRHLNVTQVQIVKYQHNCHKKRLSLMNSVSQVIS